MPENNSERCEELIEMGEEVMESKETSDVIGVGSYISNNELASQWRSESLTFLSELEGESSHSYQDFNQATKPDDSGSYDPKGIQNGIGVLRAAKSKIED